MTRTAVLVFAASNKAASINKSLALHAANVLRHELGADADIQTLDLNDLEMQVYSHKTEKEGIPVRAEDFLYTKLGVAGGTIISCGEHNGNYTATFKMFLIGAAAASRRCASIRTSLCC